MLTQWQMIRKAPKYITDALKSFELATNLETISIDDKKEIVDYLPEEILKEAKYVLSLYEEGGTGSHDELNGEYGPEVQKKAKKDVQILKHYIKKYSI